MPDFSSYELSNFLLFSARTYELLVEDYNRAVWPLHLLALLSGIAIVVLAARRRGGSERAIGPILVAIAWITVAWAFHLQRYASINWTAKWFAAAFVVQAALVAGTDLAPRRSSRTTLSAIRVAGSTLALLAIVALPATVPGS